MRFHIHKIFSGNDDLLKQQTEIINPLVLKLRLLYTKVRYALIIFFFYCNLQGMLCLNLLDNLSLLSLLKTHCNIKIEKRNIRHTCEACMTVKTATEKKRQNSTTRNDNAPTCLVATWLIHAPNVDGAKGSVKTPAWKELTVWFFFYICLCAWATTYISGLASRSTSKNTCKSNTARNQHGQNHQQKKKKKVPLIFLQER